jgi:hypothetical protein
MPAVLKRVLKRFVSSRVMVLAPSFALTWAVPGTISRAGPRTRRPLSKRRLRRRVSLAPEGVGDGNAWLIDSRSAGDNCAPRIDLVQSQSPLCVLQITNRPFLWVAVARALSIECSSARALLQEILAVASAVTKRFGSRAQPIRWTMRPNGQDASLRLAAEQP